MDQVGFIDLLGADPIGAGVDAIGMVLVPVPGVRMLKLYFYSSHLTM